MQTENITIEAWKDVVGYEGLYQISSFGRVKRLSKIVNSKNGSKRIIKEKFLVPKKHGYLRVGLTDVNGIVKHMSIHRLSAIAFLKTDSFKLTVDHIDENKNNNNIENLRWISMKENINSYKAKRNMLRKELNPNSVLNEKDLRHIVDEFDRSKTNKNIVRALSNGYKISRTHVYRILNGKYYC